VDKENNEKDLSSLSSSVDERKVSRSKMIKYVLMGGLLLGAVVAIILGSMYVVHLRTISNNQSDNLQALGLSLGTSHPTSRPTPVLRAPTAIPTRVRAAPTAMPTSPNLPESEREALYDLYNSTNGDNWEFYSGAVLWDFSDPNFNPCASV